MKRKSPYRYSVLERNLKNLYRFFNPVPRSPWTDGFVEDICSVNLVPPDNLIDFFVGCIQELQKIKGNDVGDYLEFGVFNGSSISSMYTARAKARADIRLFGFDAFEGLPESAENEDDGVWKKGFYSCAFEQMKTCLSKKDINPNSIEWVNGWYEETLSDELTKQFNLSNLGIVFIDCDTYSSSKTVLNFIAPIIKSPVIICLDDWKLNNLDIKGMGEYKAFNEFLEENPHFMTKELTSYNRKSKTFLIDPRPFPSLLDRN